MTQSPKQNLTRNRSATQLHRTKTIDANATTTKFWPTSYGSSEFGHPKSITVEFFPTHSPDFHPSQLNFLDIREHPQSSNASTRKNGLYPNETIRNSFLSRYAL
jgi:hypothetical protein